MFVTNSHAFFSIEKEPSVFQKNLAGGAFWGADLHS